MISNKSITHLTTIVLLMLVMISTSLGARRDKLELIRADEVKSFTRSGQTYRRLVGDVKLRRGKAVLSCDVAEFQVESDEARLSGHVKIVSEDAELTGDRALYYGDREYVEIVGNARFVDDPYIVTAEKLAYYIDLKKVLATDTPSLIDSGSTLSADTIYYYEDSQLGDARGQALMLNSTDSLSVEGNRLLYYSGKDSLLSYGNAKFKKWSTTDTSLNINSDSLSLEDGYFFAWPQVELINGDARGNCGQAVYMQDDEVAIMKIDPILKQGDYVLSGDVFNLHMEDGELSSVYVPENPHFTQEKQVSDTSYTDWLDGKVMAVEFEEGQPRIVTLLEMATSFFNVIEDFEFKGSNNVSGDTLIIQLSDSSISNIKVTGGAQGKFKPAKDSEDIDFPIDYMAEEIHYSMQDETTLLKRNSTINYGDMTMTAGQVGVYWRKNLLRARSIVDTLGATDYPVLRQEGQDDFRGESMIYDLETQRGKVTAGRTATDEGNYYGEKVTRVNQDVFLMEDGTYTTCSLEEHPHFYFYSKQMKLLTDKIIIARPVVLYIADIPVLALPFAVFPQKKGRSSGFILPSYDYRPNSGGRALKGFGYYWAISDYSDFKVTGDFWDQYEEFKFRSVLRYKKRYRIDGGIDGSMASNRTALGQPATWKWKLKFHHNQTIDPSFSIRANGDLSGDANFDRTFSHDQEQRLNAELRSGISIKKAFKGIKSNLSVNGNYNENLQVTRRVGETPESAGLKLSGPTLTMPSWSFNRSSSPLIKAKGNETYWYNSFRWSYNHRFYNKRQWSYESYALADTTIDSLYWDTITKDTRTWNHNMSLSGDTQILDAFKLVGSVSYTDAWAFRYLDPVLNGSDQVEIDTSTGALATREMDGFIRRGTFSTSASINTKLYGIFPVHIGPLQAIRHTLTPKVSLSYTPNFSTEPWGYTQTLTDETGDTHLFDRFAGSDIGATPARDALRINYSLSNVFDYKLLRGEKASKSQFFTWNLGGSYNFKADSIKASDISNTFKLNLGRNFTLSPRATFEIYERDSSGTRKINKYRSPRMTRANFNFGFKLQGKAPGGLRSLVSHDESADSADVNSGDSYIPESRPGRPGGAKSAWTANLNFSYTFSQLNPYEEARQTFNLATSFNFNLSENWGVTYRPRFDLIERKLVSGSVGVTRDLHCWKMTLSWTPMGRWGGINLTIRPKASQLQDLKVEHKSKRRY